MDIYSTGVLAAVVRNLFVPPSHLLDTYFPNIQEETAEEIHFDVENGARRIAPFCSPLVAGKIVQGQGYRTNTFKPAYIKDKRVFTPNKALKRSIGEQIGGSLSPEQRMQANLVAELNDQVSMIQRRMEVMASEALRTGHVIVAGEDYPSTDVDFGRDGDLTIDSTGGDAWDQNGVNPLDDLAAWGTMVLKLSGAYPRSITMDADTWSVFRKNSEVQKELDRLRGNSTLVTDAQQSEGAQFMGTIQNFDIWVYQGWYVNGDGDEVPILPAGTVIGGSPALMGYRAYGAIQDIEAGLQAMAYFPKSWIEKDPSVRYLLMQSAPLTVPYRVNASYCATVLD